MDHTSLEKLTLSLRYYLQGKGYHKALEAYAVARAHHVGLRKDGKTPELQHPVEIALHVITLKDLVDEEGTIIVSLLHDVQEDHNVSDGELEKLFGRDVLTSIKRCDKRGKSAQAFYDEAAEDCRASIAKGCDRVHNFQTMPGVFDEAKQESYIREGVQHFLPMLKAAAYKFPSQQLAYMNIRQLLKRQVQLLRFAHSQTKKVRAELDKKIDTLNYDLIHTTGALERRKDEVEDRSRELNRLGEDIDKLVTELTGARPRTAAPMVHMEILKPYVRELARAHKNRHNGTHTILCQAVANLIKLADDLPELMSLTYPNQRYMIKDIFRDSLRILEPRLVKEMVFMKGEPGVSSLERTSFPPDVLPAGGSKQETVG